MGRRWAGGAQEDIPVKLSTKNVVLLWKRAAICEELVLDVAVVLALLRCVVSSLRNENTCTPLLNEDN